MVIGALACTTALILQMQGSEARAESAPASEEPATTLEEEAGEESTTPEEEPPDGVGTESGEEQPAPPDPWGECFIPVGLLTI